MTWSSFHRRGDVLRNVVEAADFRRDGVLPMDLDGVVANFADELDFLAALVLRWHARLSGSIERALLEQPLDLTAAVAQAWAEAAATMPGVRAIIDRYADEPSGSHLGRMLARAQEKEWLKLAAAAGLASDESSAAVRAGANVQRRARALLEPTASIADTQPIPIPEFPIPGQASRAKNASFIDRIRAAIPA